MGSLTDLRESTSMNYCLTDIPQRVRRGFAIVDVQFLCLDVADEFLAIGTNIGIIYWCNRKNNKVERLRPEKCVYPISSVKVISSVDYMVAAGDNEGVISIFIIPKEKSEFLPAVCMKSFKKTIERFTVTGIHTTMISAIEWSVNGQKLFTGDEKGIVTYTEMDFCLNIVKSMELVNEKFRIVQLSYSQPQILLIASEYRCIIYNQATQCTIYQVGQKERLKVGAVIGCHSSLAGPVIYSARPKQRIWLADTHGQVCRTFLFKEALSQNYPKIILQSSISSSKYVSPEKPNHAEIPAIDSLNCAGFKSNNTTSEVEFNVLKIYKSKFLLVHDSKTLILLNVEDTTVETGLSLKRIISVATNRDEIFLLEDFRHIRRLAFTEDPFYYSKSNNLDGLDTPITNVLLDVVSKIKEETSSNLVKPLIKNMKRIEQSVRENEPSPAEEALALIKNIHVSDKNDVNDGKLSSSYNTIDEKQDIFHQKKVKNTGASKNFGHTNKERNITNSGNGTNSVPDEMIGLDVQAGMDSDKVNSSNLKSNIINATKIKEDCRRQKCVISFEHLPEDIVPDLRAPDTIMRDVIDKENKLARLLNTCDEPSNSDIVSTAPPLDTEENLYQWSSSSLSLSSLTTLGPSFDVLQTSELQFSSSESHLLKHDDGDDNFDLNENKNEMNQHFSDNETVRSCYDYYWKQFNLSFAPRWMCVTGSSVYFGDPKLAVYQADVNAAITTFRCKKENYRSLKISVSPSNQILWKLDLGVAYAFVPEINEWKITARNVENIAVNDFSAWYICKSQIFVQTNLTPVKPLNDNSVRVKCLAPISKIWCFRDAVWVLTVDGKVLSRENIDENNVVGTSWKTIRLPENVVVSDVALACRTTGWIIDRRCDIYFTDNFHSSSYADWWQVVVGRCIYKKEDTSLSGQLSKFMYRSKEIPSPSLVASNDNAIWVIPAGEKSVYINKTAVLGHRWIALIAQTLHFKTKWKYISGAGANEKTTGLWCLNSNNDLFFCQPNSNIIRAIEAPATKEIVCLTATPDTLWVLTKDGEIYGRVGIGETNAFGCFWQQLNPSISNDENTVIFKCLSCSLDVIWGISDNDEIYAAVAIPNSITADTFILDWKLIEDVQLHDSKFVHIIVGPNKYMVWALDHMYNVYVRQAIFDDFPFGTEWIYVPGIRAVHLTISNSAVWALTVEGNIYRRFGISPSNFIGDYWLKIPGSLSLITASVNEELWGVSKVTGLVLKYEKHMLVISKDFIRDRKFSENLEEEWEIIQ